MTTEQKPVENPVKMKTCSECGETKPFKEFSNRKDTKDGKQLPCKECQKAYREDHKEEKAKYQKQYRQDHKEEKKEYSKDYYHNKGGRERAGHQSMYENKSCPAYLGLVVGEQLARRLFKNVTMMPYGHPGYDMVCQNNFRINIKTSTIHVTQNKNSTTNYWQFRIEHNKDCDFFLCLVFDNVIDPHPLFGFLIPGKEVNGQASISISATTLQRWDKWKMDFDNAQACCDLIKGVSNDE